MSNTQFPPIAGYTELEDVAFDAAVCGLLCFVCAVTGYDLGDLNNLIAEAMDNDDLPEMEATRVVLERELGVPHVTEMYAAVAGTIANFRAGKTNAEHDNHGHNERNAP